MQPRVEKILNGLAKSQRIANAYLFVGPPGAGKSVAAEYLADLIKCQKQDRFFIVPDGRDIKIDQIREVAKWVRFGPSISPYLMVVVKGADLLTDQAAAAFLKTLEEPAPAVIFVLLAEREDKILPTINSRCQKLFFAESSEPVSFNQSWQQFFSALESVGQASQFELLKLSSQLEQEKENLEKILYQLAYYSHAKLRKEKFSRIIIDTVRYIKRRANLRLALDNMCLDLGAANAN